MDIECPDQGPSGLNTHERAQRNLRVVQDRARGLSWTRIGDRHGISDRQARRIVTEYRRAGPGLREYDPVEIVEEVLDAQEAALDDLAVLAETTTNPSVELGAIKTKLAVHRERLELLGAIGLLPNMGQLRIEIDLRQIADRLCTVLSAPEVSPELRERIFAAIDPHPQEALPPALVQANGSPGGVAEG
jgi:Homeodomain-like domain